MPVWVGFIGMGLALLAAAGCAFIGVCVAINLLDDRPRLDDWQRAERLATLNRQYDGIAAIEQDLTDDEFAETDREWCSMYGIAL